MHHLKLKNILFITLHLLSVTIANTQSAGSGTDKSAGIASLDITSDDKGIVIPRMDSLGRTLITTPAQGLMIYQTDKQTGFYYYSGTSWGRVGEDAYQHQGSRMTAPGVGIGTTTPDNLLQIVGGDNATLYQGSGYVTLGTIPATNMVLDQNGIQVRNNSVAGNLRLQESGGNVYIDNPEATLYVRGTEDISLTDDEGLAVLGPTTGLNIAIDNNEIMARNNGNRSTLNIQNDGGDTHIGGHLRIDSSLQGRIVLDPVGVYISGTNVNLQTGNNTFINVWAVEENPTPVVTNITGYSTPGRILFLQNDTFNDWILEESQYINLNTSSITLNGRDVVMLVSDGVAYNLISFSNVNN